MSRRRFRYNFILALAALATSLAAAGGWHYARASAPVSGPIILVSIDSLRADRLPVYGYQGIKTPALDMLAADGAVFERAYSHAPQTLPAHVSLMTGRLPFETGVRDSVGFVVEPDQRLLAEMLGDRGYDTAGVVSLFALNQKTGIGQGFDLFDDGQDPIDVEPATADVKRDGADVEAIAERWLDGHHEGRTFLFIHLSEPHAPYTPRPEYPGYTPYEAEIAYADEIVGRLIQYLKSNQLYDRSTIVLLSDHGEGLGDHGEQGHGLFLYEEAIHVPLIIKQEGGAGAGRRITDVVQHVDVVPTILDFARAPIPGNLRGRSLKPALDGTGRLPDRAVYSEAMLGRYHFGWSELTALTSRTHRFISAPRPELYDLQQDPGERQSLTDSDEAGDAYGTLRDALETLTRGVALKAPADVSPADLERLRALGYVGEYADTSTLRGADLPDPKDHADVLETYREAARLAADRQFGPAITLFTRMLRDRPNFASAWQEVARLSGRADRNDQALAAYRRVIELQPEEPHGYLGAAAVLLKERRLDESRKQAAQAADIAADSDLPSRAAAHELLARIAVAERDAGQARREAGLAMASQPGRPVPSYIEGRLSYDEGDYEGALAHFDEAVNQLAKSEGARMAELHFYLGETLVRLQRSEEATAQYAAEIKAFPQSTAARAALARLHLADGRVDEASEAIAGMLKETPTPQTYALAARLWNGFGHSRQAEAVRAESRRTFPSARDRAPATP